MTENQHKLQKDTVIGALKFAGFAALCAIATMTLLYLLGH